MPAPAPPPVPGPPPGPPPGPSQPAPEPSSAGGARRRRIGLYGGSFDPVHAGHLHAARAALAAFDLERVVFVPAERSPHKLARELASGADRLAMLALAIAGEPRFAISDLELARGGPSYTIDTVRALPQVLGVAEAELHLILGSDTLPDFPRWREAAELVRRTQPIVVHREGDPETRLAEIERALGSEARRKFERGYLRLPPVDVSSTELRAPAGLDTGGEKLPRAVLDYIETRGLYGAQARTGDERGSRVHVIEAVPTDLGAGSIGPGAGSIGLGADSIDLAAGSVDALAACAVAALACFLLRRAALAWHWLDAAESAPGRKRQTSPVPPVGGAAIALALLLALTLDRGLGTGLALAPWWRDADPRWLGLGLACAFAVGLVDDLVAGGLSPFAKVAGQALAGLALALACAPLASPAIEGSAIVLLAVAAQNALNTFDNVDGAAGGLAFAGLAPGATSAAGAVLGFLAFNLAPRGARVYLGDAGSHLLGLVLLLSPHGAAALLLPALDLARLACVRLATGSRPWIGDRRHLAHRMEAAGFGRLATAALLAALAALPVVGHAFFGASGLASGAAALALAFVLLVRATPSPR